MTDTPKAGGGAKNTPPHVSAEEREVIGAEALRLWPLVDDEDHMEARLTWSSGALWAMSRTARAPSPAPLATGGLGPVMLTDGDVINLRTLVADARNEAADRRGTAGAVWQCELKELYDRLRCPSATSLTRVGNGETGHAFSAEQALTIWSREGAAGRNRLDRMQAVLSAATSSTRVGDGDLRAALTAIRDGAEWTWKSEEGICSSKGPRIIAEAALRASGAGGGDGWALVPREVTEPMRRACWEAQYRELGGSEREVQVLAEKRVADPRQAASDAAGWIALLAAAPPPPAAGGRGDEGVGS